MANHLETAPLKVPPAVFEAPKMHRFVQVPIDRERGPSDSFTPGSSEALTLSLPSAAFDIARQAELLGALLALLSRYSEQTTISLDVSIQDGKQVRSLTLDIEAHAGDPVSNAIDAARAALSNPKSLATSPSNVAVTFLPVPGSDLRQVVLTRDQEMHFVFRQDERNGLAIAVAYNTELVHAATISRLLKGFDTLDGAARRAKTTPIERLALLTQSEEQALIQNGGVVDFPPLTVHQWFGTFAKARPNALAASFQEQRISYGELEVQSDRLASYLMAQGVGSGIPVGVCVRPSLEILISVLAIWKAGGIYLPLDATHPPALIMRMLEEAQPRLVLTTSALAELTSGFPQFLFDCEARELESPVSDTGATTSPGLDTPAYLFYTSGTTGKPKGVLATHRNLAQYIRGAALKYGFNAQDVFVSLARYTFSISLFELISPLCCGGSLRLLERDEVLSPERLSRALEEVTVMHAGPSLLGSLFRYMRLTPEGGHKTLPRMRHASSGGDIVSVATMEVLKRVFPNAELFVIYGCTEISCMGTTFAIPRDASVRRTFVGKPFPNVTVCVLDAQRKVVPFGVVGDICFAGHGVVPGYLNRPELTAEKFIEVAGGRYYQTGDMGRLHEDGNLEILGRRDFQIQLRGIRIELAGIEQAVLALGLAAQCAVIAKTVEDGDKRLIVFVVKPTVESTASFRRKLGVELPDYMLPNHVVVLEAMPLTVNGKLDRNQLQEMRLENQLPSGNRTPPANEREREIAQVFARALGLAEVGVEDSFFDLGGDSLRAVVLLEAIEQAIGVAITPHVLFEAGTTRALAAYSLGTAATELRPILLNASPGPTLFMLSGVHVYRQLAKRLGDDYACYGVFTQREVEAFDPASKPSTIEDMAREYVEVLRLKQAKGPYRLLGYSFAGLIAYEVAQQLRAAGEEVRFLGLVDSSLPEWAWGWRFRLSQLVRLGSAPLGDVLSFVSRRIRRKSGSNEMEFLQHQQDAELGPLEMARNNANRKAAEDYLFRLRPFSGTVTLITAHQRLRDDPLKSPSCGWDRYVPQLKIHTVEADHFQMLSSEPHLSGLARALREDMRRADGTRIQFGPQVGKLR